MKGLRGVLGVVSTTNWSQLWHFIADKYLMMKICPVCDVGLELVDCKYEALSVLKILGAQKV